VSTASVLDATLSPASIIAIWSVVRGAPGAHCVSCAPARARAERDVQERAALAEHLGDRQVELVPRHDVRPAELERPVRGLRIVDGA